MHRAGGLDHVVDIFGRSRNVLGPAIVAGGGVDRRKDDRWLMLVHRLTPSSVSRFARSTFSHEGRRVTTANSRLFPLLPSWEKVPEGRMRGACDCIMRPHA